MRFPTLKGRKFVAAISFNFVIAYFVVGAQRNPFRGNILLQKRNVRCRKSPSIVDFLNPELNPGERSEQHHSIKRTVYKKKIGLVTQINFTEILGKKVRTHKLLICQESGRNSSKKFPQIQSYFEDRNGNIKTVGARGEGLHEL